MIRRLLLAASLLASSCGGPAIDASQVLRDSATAVGRLHSVSGVLEFSAGTVNFQNFTLVSARTTVVLPTDSDTTYAVRSGDTSVDLRVIVVKGDVYLKVFFGGFAKQTADQAATIPDLSLLFDQRHGLPFLVSRGKNPGYVTDESLAGVNCHEVTTTFTAAQVHSLLKQLSSSGDVKATIWAGINDHLIRKAVLDGPFGDKGSHATVTVTLSGFDQATSISVPGS